MANQTAQQNKINLISSLNTSKNKCEIKPFDGFNKRNNPFVNNALSPMFSSEEREGVLDKFGNSYTIEETTGNKYIVKKNDQTFFTGIKKSVKHTIINKPKGVDMWCADSEGNIAYVKKDTVYYRGKSIVLDNVIAITYSYGLINVVCTSFGIGAKCYILEEKDDWTFLVCDLPKARFANYEKISSCSSKIFTDINDTYDILELILFFNDGVYISAFFVNEKGNPINNYSYISNYILYNDSGHYSDSGVHSDSNKYSLSFDKQLVYYKTTLKSEVAGQWYHSINNCNYTLRAVSVDKTAGTITATELDRRTIKVISEDTYTKFNQTNSFDGYRFSSHTHMTKYNGDTKNGETYVVYENDNYVSTINSKCFCLAGSNRNNVNSAYSSKYFRFLYNSNTLSGVSVYIDNENDNTSHYGKLLLGFASINSLNHNIYISEDYTQCFVYDNNDDLHIFEITEDLPELRVYGDYIVSNSLNANAYDTINNTVVPFFLDWNNRIVLEIFNTLSFSSSSPSKTIELASAYNAEYQSTRDKVSSMILNPLLLENASADFNIGYEQNLDIVVRNSFGLELNNYYSNNNITPVYYNTTAVNGFPAYKQQLKDLSYPVSVDGNIQLTPSMFSKIYSTPLNDDYVKEGDDYYNMVYWEQQPYMLYWYASGIKQITQTFIIQGMRYAIKDNVIYSCSYQNQILTDFEAIVNIGDSVFVGCNQQYAVFFSKQNKQFYTFGGDRLLQPNGDATEVNEILSTGYCCSTNSIYVSSDKKVYVFYPIAEGIEVYTIDTPVEEMFEMYDGAMAFKTTKNKWIIYDFNKTDICNKKESVNLSTCFYGSGNNIVSVLDCVYLRLFSEEAEEGNVSINTITITNKGTESKKTVFHITKEMWDSLTSTYYLRFQLTNQRSVGTMFEIESDFAIYDFQISSKPDTVQISSGSKGGI